MLIHKELRPFENAIVPKAHAIVFKSVTLNTRLCVISIMERSVDVLLGIPEIETAVIVPPRVLKSPLVSMYQLKA